MKSRPWMVQVVSQGDKKPEKEVVHPIFLKALDFCNDPMWRDIFYSAAYGRLPRGFIYKDNSIIHKVKSKTFRLEVPFDPQEAYRKCVEYFQQRGGIFSRQDCEVEQVQETTTDLTWNEIKRRKLRDVLFYHYSQIQISEHNLNPQEKRQLDDMLSILNFLDIPATEVELEEGRIKHLHCLVFDETQRRYHIHLQFLQNTKRSPNIPQESEKASPLLKNWSQFLNNCHLSQRTTLPASSETNTLDTVTLQE